MNKPRADDSNRQPSKFVAQLAKKKPNENTCIASDCFLVVEAIEAFYSK